MILGINRVVTEDRKTDEAVKATGVGLRAMRGEKLPTAITGSPLKESTKQRSRHWWGSLVRRK